MMTPEETTKRFFAAMTDWEVWSAEVNRLPPNSEAEYEAGTQLRVDRLRKIFETYLSTKAFTRGQSRCELAMYGTPPEYDLKTTKTEEISKGKCFVYTQEDGWVRPETRYLLLKEGDQWRIDYREVSDPTGKWIKEREL